MFKVAVLGSQDRIIELKEKIADKATIDLITENDLNTDVIATYEIIFDLNADERKTETSVHSSFGGFYIRCAVLKTLSTSGISYSKILGANLLPGFINRSLLEVSVTDKNTFHSFAIVADALGWKLTEVQDRVGMVTPRIVCMIINEAYFTLQEGTASEKDIDTGMKLGTNYPFGPFEWSKKIGISSVYRVLESIYEDTKEERYKICPTLKLQKQKSL